MKKIILAGALLLPLAAQAQTSADEARLHKIDMPAPTLAQAPAAAPALPLSVMACLSKEANRHLPLVPPYSTQEDQLVARCGPRPGSPFNKWLKTCDAAFSDLDDSSAHQQCLSIVFDAAHLAVQSTR